MQSVRQGLDRRCGPLHLQLFLRISLQARAFEEGEGLIDTVLDQGQGRPQEGAEVKPPVGRCGQLPPALLPERPEAAEQQFAA